MEPTAHLAALRTSSGALLETAPESLDRAVPSCPDWIVADIVAHVGQVWAWAATVVASGERTDRRDDPPLERAELLGWAGERAAMLIAGLEAADPDSGCWTFGLPRTRRFWFRRQALEATLHAWDAQLAVGTPHAIDPDLASDGIDEYLTVLLPRRLGREPGTWEGQTLHLHRTDGEGEWHVRLGPAGSVEVERAHAKGDVALRGSAQDLWLWCTNRAALDRAPSIDVFGDRSVAERWTAEIAF